MLVDDHGSDAGWKTDSSGARERGGIILLLTCVSLPVSVFVSVLWDWMEELLVYGLMIVCVAIVWIRGARRELAEDGQG